MMSGRRLPVAPRPYRDELLSSWLGRVACRYGLDAASLVGALAADGEGAARGIPIDDAAPPREDIVSWAQACGVDPARLSRLTLARRRPGRPKAWFSSQGPPWAPTASRSPPACCACFESDRAAGRDEHLRADWMLAERCVCPAHRQLLRDRCPRCRGRLHFGFRLRDGRARVVCGECEQELAARSAGEADGALIEALISLQARIGAIVRGPPQGRKRLEEAVSILWAARLSRRRRGRRWRCGSTKAGGGAWPKPSTPSARPSHSRGCRSHWRVATLIAAEDAFGLGEWPLDDALELGALLIRRAAPLRGLPRRGTRRGASLRWRRARRPNTSGSRARSGRVPMASRRRAANGPPFAGSLAIDGRRSAPRGRLQPGPSRESTNELRSRSTIEPRKSDAWIAFLRGNPPMNANDSRHGGASKSCPISAHYRTKLRKTSAADLALNQ